MKVFWTIGKAFCSGILLAACSDALVSPDKASLGMKAKLERVSPVFVNEGSTVFVEGSDLGKKLSLNLNGVEIAFTVESANRLSFEVPALSEAQVLIISKGDEEVGRSTLYPANKQFAEIDAAKVCKGQTFQNLAGVEKEGSRDCEAVTGPALDPCTSDGQADCLANQDFPAVDKTALDAAQGSLRKTLTLAGVGGTLDSCSDDSSACYLPAYSVMTQPLKAVDVSSVSAAKILTGLSFAGVAGSLLAAPAVCSADNQTACVSGSNFPAAQRSLLDTSKFRQSLQILGQNGAINDCAANASACFLPPYLASTQGLKAIDFDALDASLIKNNVNIGGVIGTLPVAAADCNTDAQNSCLTTSNYPAIEAAYATANKAKYHSTITVGGVAGTMADCTANGTGCQATAIYPAINKNTLDTNLAKILGTASVHGSSGTAAACAANASNCYIASYVLTTQPLKAIDVSGVLNSVVKQGSTIAGVAGNVIESPANCLADAAINCVTSAALPSIDQAAVDGVKTKIHNSLTIGGVAGTMAPCAADGVDGCYTVTNFPTLQKSTVTPANMHTSLTVAGVVGTMDDCSNATTTSCRTIASHPSVNRGLFDTNKALIRDNLTIAGLSGTLADCGLNGSNCFLPTYQNGVQNKKAIDVSNLTAANIRNNITIAGILGTRHETPAVCVAGNLTNCVTDADFPALHKSGITASKLRDSLTVAGVQGSMADCAAAGSGCYTNNNFLALDRANLLLNTESVLSTYTLSAVSGAMNACAALASNCFLPTYANGSEVYKAINFDSISATNIKNLETIAGIQGNMVVAPANCNGDNQTGCTAVTNYPALNKTTANNNRNLYLTTITAGGVSGLLANCSGDNGTSCYATSNFPSVIANTIDTNKAKLRSTQTFGGITGTMGTCAEDASACFLATYAATTQPLKAINYNTITPGIVKNGVTIAGVPGQYPNATYTLDVPDAYDDLASATLGTQLAAAANFGWYDRNGTRYARTGDTELLAENIRKDTDIFGVVGNFTIPSPWDVRINKSYDNALTGKLKTSCRSLRNTAISLAMGMPRLVTTTASNDRLTLNSHGLSEGQQVRFGWGTNGGTPNSANLSDTQTLFVKYVDANNFQLAYTNGGAAIDVQMDTINAAIYTYGNNVDPTVNTADFHELSAGAISYSDPWPNSDHTCEGLEVTANDGKAWKDVTSGGCTGPGVDCVYQSKLTNLQWTRRQGGTNAKTASARCEALTYAGKSDWRLPSQYEYMEAGAAFIYSLGNANWTSLADFQGGNRRFWASTKSSTSVYDVKFWELYSNYSATMGYADWASFICVRHDNDSY